MKPLIIQLNMIIKTNYNNHKHNNLDRNQELIKLIYELNNRFLSLKKSNSIKELSIKSFSIRQPY